MDIKQQIKDSRNISDSSLKTYICALKIIKKNIDGDTKLDDINFLKNYDKVMDYINDLDKITSKKNKLTAIIVALSSEKNKNEKLIDKYQIKLKELTDNYYNWLKKQEKTDKQKDNWLEYNDLLKIINNITQKIKLDNILKKDKLNNNEYNLLQQLVILRTYLDYPIRNDFANMIVIKKNKYDKLNDDEKDNNNFLLINNGNKQFIINQFKNKKSLGGRVFNINNKLNRLINIWLKHNISGFYLTQSDRKNSITSNGITKFLNKIFIKHAGKNISTSMIRHIIISHLSKGKKSILEKEAEDKKIENKFMHTSKINDIYRKI